MLQVLTRDFYGFGNFAMNYGIVYTAWGLDGSANRKWGLFTKQDFRYDQEEDCYWCAAGEIMTFRFQTTEKNREIKYYASCSCNACRLKHKCTRSKDGRRITRWVDEDLLDEMQKRIKDNPDLRTSGKAIVEYPFPLRGSSTERSN